MALFFFLFALTPFVELWLLIRIGRIVGGPTTLLYVVAMIFIGSWLAREQGRRVIEQAQAALAQGRVPEEELLAGALVLVGGVLLIVPGVITDVLGLLCLVPITRRAITALLARQLASRVANGTMHVQGFGGRWPPTSASRPPVRGDVIDTEGEDITEDPKQLR